MSESGDYSPAAHWKGHDFASLRRSYDDHVASSMSKAVSSGVSSSDLIPETIETDCESPIVIAVDVTGSMGAWPATIFSKLPYLEHEAKEYYGDDFAISFSAVGDSFHDKYPLQVREFVQGAELENELKELVIESGGGGNMCESYDLAAMYYASNCEMPEAIRKPVFIFIGDEGLFEGLSANAESICHVKNDKRMTLKSLFEKLKKKFNVYCIRKSYYTTADSDQMDRRESAIQEQWEELLGARNVFALPEPERVVDVIFGIFGHDTDRLEYFEEELRDRQGKDDDGDHKIDIVLKTLHTVHDPKSVKKIANPKSRSVTTRKSSKKMKSISLLDD